MVYSFKNTLTVRKLLFTNALMTGQLNRNVHSLSINIVNQYIHFS